MSRPPWTVTLKQRDSRWQIEQTRQLKLPHLYLGYWIAQSDKMAYKAGFGPYQLLQEGGWEWAAPPATPTPAAAPLPPDSEGP